MGGLLEWNEGLLGATLPKKKSPIIDSRIFPSAHRASVQLQRLDEMQFRFRRHAECGEIERRAPVDLRQHLFRRCAQGLIERLASGFVTAHRV